MTKLENRIQDKNLLSKITKLKKLIHLIKENKKKI